MADTLSHVTIKTIVQKCKVWYWSTRFWCIILTSKSNVLKDRHDISIKLPYSFVFQVNTPTKTFGLGKVHVQKHYNVFN